MSRTFPRSCYSVSYAIKNQLVASKAYNRTFPCMEANYPYAIKNQRGASKKPLVGGFGWMRWAGSFWHKIAGVATPRNRPRHGGGQPCLVVVSVAPGQGGAVLRPGPQCRLVRPPLHRLTEQRRHRDGRPALGSGLGQPQSHGRLRGPGSVLGGLQDLVGSRGRQTSHSHNDPSQVGPERRSEAQHC